jgi:hypothetical protein
VWASTVGDRLVGPHVFQQCQTDNVYSDFCLNGLPRLLKNVPLAVGAWFMHDGAAAFLAHLCGIHSKINTYHDNCIGRAGPLSWPPRSSDLSPLDFWLG